MREAGKIRRNLFFLMAAGLALLVTLCLQINFSLMKGGWLIEEPRVETRAENVYEETLRVVADIDFAPYSSVDESGNATGHDIECINAIGNRLQRNVEVQLMTWTNALAAVKSGEADVVMGLESISSRNDGLRITSIIADDSFVVYGKTPIGGIDDLKTSRIATIKGKTEIDIYRIEENAVEYETYSEELDALEREEIDYAVIRASVAKILIAQRGYTDLIQVFDVMDSGLGLGVRVEDTALADELETVILSLQRDGTLAALQEKWLTTYVSRHTLWELIRNYPDFYLGSFALVCLFLTTIMVLVLQQKNLAKESLAREELARAEMELAKKQAELADGRARMMLSQIRPHFLYNVLGTIGQLCRKDPVQAADAVDTFARYLRSNLSSVEQQDLVPFEQELQHVRTYIALEQLRFGEELEMTYDLSCLNFSLPSLSVQPLVENAVKHGIGQREDGGTISLRTREDEDCRIIEIVDNGVGFDVESVRNDGKLHIGIDNVRLRVETMCRGTLEIRSEIGKGTIAAIRIPKESEKDESTGS